MAIATMVLLLSFNVFAFGNNVFKKGNEQYDIQSDVRIVSDYIQNQVRYATSLQLVTELPPNSRGDLATDDVAKNVVGLEYIVLENNKLVHYVIGNNVDTDGNLVGSDEFEVKYVFPNTLPGTSFESSSANELVFVVNASDRPGNYALRSLINLPNYSIHNGMVIEKVGEEGDLTIGIRFSRDAGMLAGLSGDGGGDGGGTEIEEPDLIVTEIVAFGKKESQNVRLTFSNEIVNVTTAQAFKSVSIENLVAVEISDNKNLPTSFDIEVTDVNGNTLNITIMRNDTNYTYLVN